MRSLILAALVLASGFARAEVELREKVLGSFLDEGDVVRTPYGWDDLCGRQPQECNVSILHPVTIKLNKKRLEALRDINAEVNVEIEPVSNMAHWGTILDHWDYPTDGKGDCKIYALWKRKKLMDLGFPRQALLMTIVKDLNGDGHTILDIKTDHGDIILDNMVTEIRHWDETGYKFIKRQTQTDPNVWIAVGPDAVENAKLDFEAAAAQRLKTTSGVLQSGSDSKQP